MCYHVSEPERTELEDLYDHAVRTDEWDTYYHHLSGFEFKKVPVLTCEDNTRIQAFNWGLIPSWSKDLEYAKEADLNNPQRVIRALEIIRSTGKKYSEFRKQSSQNQEKARQERKQRLGFETIKIMLDRPREELYQRINQRVLKMIENGLVEEVKNLQEYAHLSPLKTVGYQEIFEYLNTDNNEKNDVKINLETAISTIQQNTRRFAKRQLTWFRKDTEYTWFDVSKPNYKEKIIAFIESLH